MKRFTAEDAETRSPDVVAQNIEQLKALFPDVITEGKVDFEVLKQLLGGAVDEREEKYGLNWHGKRRARQLALTPSTGTLRPCPEESVDWDTTRNLMIEGDNLEVLKLLQKSYSGKVKLIYIDPPYNKRAEVIYPDDFQDNIKNYLQLTGQADSDGRKLASNTEASGRFHTDWLNMMYPRLKLAQSTLCEGGVILVSIDDGEVSHLRFLLDAIFGTENFLGSFVWQGGRKNDARLISLGHDYIVVYARNAGLLKEKETRWRERKLGLDAVYSKVAELRTKLLDDFNSIHEALLEWYRNLSDENLSKAHDHFSYVDERGIYFPDNLRSPNPRKNLVYDWKGYKPHPNGWAYGREKMAQLDAEGRLIYPESNEQRIKLKSYLSEHENWAPGSVFYKDRRGASKSLTSLMEAEVFDFPKDPEIISRLIEAISEDGDIVFDFFAGSGATGHAVFASNLNNKTNRRFILVQLPEPLDPNNKDQKVAADYCDQLGKPRTIAELTKERLRRGGKSFHGENPLFSGDLGFRVFKLASSNIRAWEPNRDDLPTTLHDSIEHLKTDRTEQDILFELLLKFGLDLTIPIEQKSIAGKIVHNIGVGTLLVCLAEKITVAEVEPVALGIAAWHKALAPVGETTVVFRDSAFADDVAKTNLTAILQQHGLENVRSL
jgi:adenine-specific DNA-methyltransferase